MNQINRTRFAVRSVCNRTNTLTDSAVEVVVREVVAAIEVQVKGDEGAGRPERTRPVVPARTNTDGTRTVTIASSWKEDTVAVRTSNSITIVPVL